MRVPLRSASAALVLAALGVLPAAARAATVSPPVALAACPTDLAVNAAGDVQLLTRTQARGRWTAAVSSVDPVGTITPVLSASRAWQRPNAVRSVFTDDGIAVAFETGQPKPDAPAGIDAPVGIAYAARAKAQPTVSAMIVGPGGASKPQVLSDPSRSAELYRITSRGGTTVVQFRQSVRGALWLQNWIAVRPAGATRFGKAVSLQAPIRARFSDDDVYLGPDGSGVVISVPGLSKLPVSARRITAQGRVGRPVAVTDRRTDLASATAAVGPTGEIVVAIVDTAKPKVYSRQGLFIARLAPGMARFSPPKLAATVRGTLDDGLALAIDGAGRVFASTFLRYSPDDPAEFHPQFLTFSGSGDQLVRGPDVDGNLAGLGPQVLTPLADGTVALSYEGYERVGQGNATSDGDFRRTQHVAFRAADGTWSAATSFPVATSLEPDSSASSRGSVALPGGGLAIAYALERDGEKTVCSLVRVTP